MNYIYEMPVVLDLGKEIPEVGEFQDSFNSHLATMVDGLRLSIVLPITSITLESSHPLNTEQLKMVHDSAKETIAKMFDFPMIVEAPRRQSRKSSKKSE